MQLQRLSIAMIATAAGLSSSAGANAAVDMFLKIDGIDGESQDSKFKGSSDVLSWAWGEVSTANGKKGCMQDMDITKPVDTASPPLITNASTGAMSPKAVLTMRDSGRGAGNFLVITMTNVKVSSYQVAAASGQNSLTENVALSFETMSGVYKKQNADGSLDAGTPWSIGPNPGKCP